VTLPARKKLKKFIVCARIMARVIQITKPNIYLVLTIYKVLC
jgi:hypothetical protein